MLTGNNYCQSQKPLVGIGQGTDKECRDCYRHVLFGPVADFYCNAQALLLVLYCLLELAKVVINIADSAIGTSLFGPVADFYCNAQLLLVVLYSNPFSHLAVLV